MADAIPIPTDPRFQDLTGLTFARLKVLAYAGRTTGRHHWWLCRCECGTEKEVDGRHLRGGVIKSCGCLGRSLLHRPPLLNLAGKRFGRWLVLSYAGQGTHKKSLWNCRCDCGTAKIVSGSSLVANGTQSCGCLSRETASRLSRVHGEGYESPEYRAWMGMRQRCYDPNCEAYRNYGGRGIRVCKRWRRSYLAFLEDVGRKPSPRHSLGRINNNVGYRPGNCRWETPKQQARNQRTSRFLTYKGETKTMAEWAERFGLTSVVIFKRLARGWTVEEALEKPCRGPRKSSRQSQSHADAP